MARAVVITFVVACLAPSGVHAAGFKQYMCDDTACAQNCKDHDFSFNTCLHVLDGSSAMYLDCAAGAGGLKGLTWTNANCSGAGTTLTMDVGTCLQSDTSGSFLNSCVDSISGRNTFGKLMHPPKHLASFVKGSCSAQVGHTLDGPEIKYEPAVPLWDCCDRCQHQVPNCVAAVLTGNGECHYKSALGSISSDPDSTVLYAGGSPPPAPPPPPATAATQYQCSDDKCSQGCKRVAFPLNQCIRQDSSNSAIITGCDIITGEMNTLVFEGNLNCDGSGVPQTDGLGKCEYDPNAQSSFINGCSYGGLEASVNGTSAILLTLQQKHALMQEKIVV